MAATASTVVNEVGDDFLSCAICLDQFTNPKIIPCFHTFCEDCLHALVERNYGVLLCPLCRKESPLPMGGVAKLQRNFYMDRLLEDITTGPTSTSTTGGKPSVCELCEDKVIKHVCIECQQYCCDTCARSHKKSKASSSHRVLTTDEYRQMKSTNPLAVQPVSYCKVHPTSQIKFYCDTCQTPVCSDCTVVKHPTATHALRDLHDLTSEYTDQLSEMMKKLKIKAKEAENNKNAAEELLKKLKTGFAWQLRGGQRLQSEDQTKHLECQREDFEFTYGNIVSMCSYVENLIQSGKVGHHLSTRQETVHRIQDLITMATQSPQQPERMRPKPSQGSCEVLREDTKTVWSSKCSVENVPKILVVGMTANIGIITRDSAEKQINIHEKVKAVLRKPDQTLEEVNIENTGDGRQYMKVHVAMEGDYHITFTIGDQQLPGSPFEIHVMKAVVKTIGKNGSRVTDWNRPSGLVINKDGCIVTADGGNYRIKVTDIHGNNILTFEDVGSTKFTPHDIAISVNNDYFMTDYHNHQVVVSKSDGNVLRCFGSTQLINPIGIAISPVDGSVYVSDWDGEVGEETNKDGHCIRKYTQNGRYIKSFGKYGTANGQFKGVLLLTINSQGIVFVVDMGNSHIQVFTADGDFMYVIGEGLLKHPKGLVLENDRYIYVTTNDDGVWKFDTDGQFIYAISNDVFGLDTPTGIAVTNDSPRRIVVSDTGNHCLKMLTVECVTNNTDTETLYMDWWHWI
ncbi:E3 ubiquitin-protein ligase TRIM45-like [Glandiceps talaboti]